MWPRYQISCFLWTLFFAHPGRFLSLSSSHLMSSEISFSFSWLCSSDPVKISLIIWLSPSHMQRKLGSLFLYFHILHFIKLAFQIHNGILNSWSYGETSTLMHWWEYKLEWSHWKTIWQSLMKIHLLTHFSPFSWILPNKKIKPVKRQRYMQKSVISISLIILKIL